MSASGQEMQKSLYQHLQSAVVNGVVPERLQAAQQSLLKKLELVSNEVNARFVDNDVMYRTPSMGMIEVIHETLDEPMALFATDLRTKNITRIRIYSAHQLKEDGLIVKDKLLTEVIMSEKQFGEILMNTNRGSGFPVTNVITDGAAVKEYKSENDASKKNMKILHEKMSEDSDQIAMFLGKIKDIVDKGVDSGRIAKSDTNEIIKYLKLIPQYAVSNNVFDLSILSENLSERVVEASLDMHLTVSTLALTEKKD